MRLLVFTQKIDQNDDLLGSFHQVIVELAAQCESVIAVGLSVGEHNLPANVEVRSLGKEVRASKLRYVLRTLQYSWKYRKQYDAVFVHMNKEYVVVAGWLWRLLGKRVAMWYNHKFGNWMARLAARIAHTIFYTSDSAFTAQFAHAHQMPVGVDTELFAPSDSRAFAQDVLRIVAVGRLSAVKRIDVMIDAVAQLRDAGLDVHFSCYGNPVDRAEDRQYVEGLHEKVRTEGLEDVVEFFPGIPNQEVAQVLQNQDVYINTTPAGSMDKTIFEAMAVAMPVVVQNTSVAPLLSEDMAKHVVTGDGASALAEQIVMWSEMDQEARDTMGAQMRDYVIAHHSMKLLAQEICKKI